ncbi:MAG TPA: hypothetical protein VK828_20140 [Terriglobales bacterium]|jgi:hypothetical protein|nr:hypothetical protein [Terriglobales bacterium]
MITLATFQIAMIPTSLLTAMNTIAMAMIGLTLIVIATISVTTVAMTLSYARRRRVPLIRSSIRSRAASRMTSRIMSSMTVLLAAAVFLFCVPQSNAAVNVDMNVSHAGPRAVESLTERGILRDYRIAWISLAHALEFNASDALSGPFVSSARDTLMNNISSQRRSGLSTRYLNQNHKVEAVYYAPEGDVIELHDAADYQLQILDGGKLIHDEHVVMHYVVLMTPAADHWVVRQLQAVSQF